MGDLLLTSISTSSSEDNNGVLIVNNGQNKENSEPNKVKTNSDPVGLETIFVAAVYAIWTADSNFGSSFYEPIDSGKNNSSNIWDHSDSEASPASLWYTLPNRSLLCRPLSVGIGRCTCIIVKEKSVDGINGGNEGQGRQNWKLDVALHRRHNSRSEFIISQNTKGILCCVDDSYVKV
ncbi:hypothetical protein LXL04_015954 [Taraxacum kok-saghyz]